MINTDVLIVGAGICGITLARNIKSSSIILEKSRGIGGRIATRRIDGLGFDHGALILKNSDELYSLLKDAQLNEKMDTHLFGIWIPEGMTQLPKKLSEKLDIRKGLKAENIHFSQNKWVVTTDSGETFYAPKLVITAPLPQALELLAKNKISYAKELEEVTYTKTIMALVTTKDDFDPPNILPEHIQSITEMKKRSLHPKGLVIQATPDFSEEAFDLPDEVNLKTLTDTLLRISPSTEIKYAEFKKWRYVLPKSVLKVPYTEVAPGLFLVGDAFSAPDVTGSLKGAIALSSKL